jgi:glycerol-3-phosphate dehydrogenase
MWTGNWREDIFSNLNQPWDIIIIGGGITGAGILRVATQLKLRALLVEQRDFGWGTSSRSSKLVHGGLRYLKEGKIKLSWESVHERERLLREGPGLIEPLGFLLANYKGDRPGRWLYGAGLTIYDLLAMRWNHRHYNAEEFLMLAPHIAHERLEGGFRFSDARTDDARLVLRVILEAVETGGVALNYAKAEELLFKNGAAKGIRLRDMESNRTTDIYAKLVVNASSIWTDTIRKQVGAKSRIRPLRGSHLIFPSWRLPVPQAISFLHPTDRRPVFIIPWENVTLVGTTDLDHDRPLDEEPRISAKEVAYLMTAACAEFPSLSLTLDDVLMTFSGVRPVVGTGEVDPSKESRDHVIWEEKGLLTVTGGKLTTFRLIALDALKAAKHHFPGMPVPNKKMPVLNHVKMNLPGAIGLDQEQCYRLLGRYGSAAQVFAAVASPEELEPIPETPYLWTELRWAARHEGVVHLEDLLMRRVRLGFLLPHGGEALLPQIRAICQPEMGWDDNRWKSEEEAYLRLWQKYYTLPVREMKNE